MSYKCKAIHSNNIQYHLIHVIITHDSNMHVYIEMYMIIIAIMIIMCIIHRKILEHVTLYPYCLISLPRHLYVFQGSSLQYLKKLEMLLSIIVNLRKMSTTTHKNKFLIPITDTYTQFL